jgi:hypothetical protein
MVAASLACVRMLCGEGVVIVGGDDGALVEEDLPVARGLLPDGGAAGEAVGLAEGVGEEVGVGMGGGAEGDEGEAGGSPACGGGVDGWVFGEHGEDEVAGVAAAGGADLPVVGGHAGVEVSEGGAEGGSVEDGFEGAELVKDGVQGGVGVGEGLAGGHGVILGGGEAATLSSRRHVGSVMR